MPTPAAQLPRCTFKGCPVRYRSGPDHPCAEHSDQWAVSRAAEELGIDMARLPGSYDTGDGDR